MCLFPFIVKWEACGCTAYRVMHRCADAGDDLFGICAETLCEATKDEGILKEIWEKRCGACPMHKYVDTVQLSDLKEGETDQGALQHPLPPFG